MPSQAQRILDRYESSEGSLCPSCTEPIPTDVSHEDQCRYCGYTFQDPKAEEQEEREDKCREWAKTLRGAISVLQHALDRLESNDFLIDSELEGAGEDIYSLKRDIENSDLTPE